MNLSNFKRFQHFKGKNIAAIDYGTKVTGLALFCPGREPYPYPAGKIINGHDDQLIDEVIKFIESEVVEVIVLGIPTLLDGQETDMTAKIRAFGKKLEEKIGSVEFYTQSESLSTYEAQCRMKESARYNFKVDPKQIDALAASIILEDFIRS